jgi:hypothetical protein
MGDGRVRGARGLLTVQAEGVVVLGRWWMACLGAARYGAVRYGYGYGYEIICSGRASAEASTYAMRDSAWCLAW